MAPTGEIPDDSEKDHATVARRESNINISMDKFKDNTQFGEFDLNL